MKKYVLFGVGKMEGKYIREWVDYHLKLGITHIYVYDNEDMPTYKDILKGYNNVTVLHLPGANNKYGLQTVVISHFQNNYIKYYDYCIHLDLDEFLCLKKHNNIQDFIKEYFTINTNAIAINWVFFGSNNLIKRDNRGVLERFTKCQDGCDQHIKLIVKVKDFIYYNGPHRIKGIENTFTKDTNGNIIESTFNPNGPIDICQINHYKVKSQEEFKIIVNRPRPDLPIGHKDRFRNNFLKQFQAYDLNHIDDFHAYYFYKFN